MRIKKYYLYPVVLSLMLLFSLTTHANQLDDLLRTNHDPQMGNPKGKITIVEFFDYQCSYCIVMAPVLAEIIRKNPDVRVIYKEFPIRGPESFIAAKAALAANKQGKYHQLNQALLATQDTLDKKTILQLAKSVGLNLKRLQQEMDSIDINRQLKANYALADHFNVQGTPVFFIGKTNANDLKELNTVWGEISLKELQEAINKLRS